MNCRLAIPSLPIHTDERLLAGQLACVALVDMIHDPLNQSPDMRHIRMRGVRTHNLKNIDIDLPRDKLIVFTGVSGSGKSSLAFDTIYAEGQRRYVESLSSYARQFLSIMEKPDIDHIEGLSPAISIEQKATSHNPRSTVGTTTEIYDYLRLLYARAGIPRCPVHDQPLQGQTVQQMVDAVLAIKGDGALMLLAPVLVERKGEHSQLLAQLKAQGFTRLRVDGRVLEPDEAPKLGLRTKHTIEVVVDRFRPSSSPDGLSQRLTESFESALRLADGLVVVEPWPDGSRGTDRQVFSSRYSCPTCGYSIPELEPRLFSFNAPTGACQQCDGLGVAAMFDPGRIVLNHSLTLAQGAVVGWGKSKPGGHRLLKSLGRHYKFDMDTPWRDLPGRIRNLVLHGTGNEAVRLTYARGRTRTRPFEGVVDALTRRYAMAEGEDRAQFAQFMSENPCPACKGERLNTAARHVFVDGTNLPAVVSLSVSDALAHFQQLALPGWRGQIATKIVKEICERLRFLVDVGLDYMTLDRRADTLSGGEAQRIRLASQIGAGLVGVMYVLDEPSIGLHQRDNARLLGTLVRLRDLGNTVIVVEHDEEAIRAADHIVDIGPQAGVHGGRVVAQGTVKQVCAAKQSITGQYLSGKRAIQVPQTRLTPDRKRMLTLKGATGNNLKSVDLRVPLGLFTCVAGVSGSGKSTLVNDTLLAAAAADLNGAQTLASPFKSISGLELLDKVVAIDQSPIGRTPRSNPATYTGLFTPLRELFAQVPEARARGYAPGRFSFNVRGGRCEACQGDGMIKVEMHFLPDVYVPCDACHGKRYNRETLEVAYKGHNINQVLEMTVDEAAEVFDAIPAVSRKLVTLQQVGLGYIRLGQSATTLSGGEAQRVKLSKELSRRGTGHTLYVLDEPTTGLHFQDIEHLLEVLMRLRDQGNTVLVIEHNLDVIKCADWVVDMGPEGGARGGRILSQGAPEDLAQDPISPTGPFLREALIPKGREQNAVKQSKARKTSKRKPTS